MAYNVYRGNSGLSRRVETPGPERPVPPPPPPGGPEPRSAPRPMSARRPGGLDPLARLRLRPMETEDLLVLAVLALAYSGSGDWEMLVAMGAYLLL